MYKTLVIIFESCTFLFLSSAGLYMSLRVVLAQDFSEEAKLEIRDILDWSQKEFNIPGSVALVTNYEGEIYAEAFGFSDVVNKTSMQVDNILAIASMTKPITSAAAIILIEDGKVLLEDQISSHLEDLPPFEIFDEFDLWVEASLQKELQMKLRWNGFYRIPRAWLTISDGCTLQCSLYAMR